MLFCPTSTQSERFLHTDQLITRLRRVEPATCCSHDGLHSRGLVGSDLPHTLIDVRQLAASVKVRALR